MKVQGGHGPQLLTPMCELINFFQTDYRLVAYIVVFQEKCNSLDSPKNAIFGKPNSTIAGICYHFTVLLVPVDLKS